MSKKHKPSKPASPSAKLRSSQKKRQQNLTWVWVSLGVIVVAAAAFLLLRPKNALPAEVSPAQAYTLYQKGAFFLDVRTQDEWNQFHLSKSTLIPLEELQNRLSELPKDKDIVVVCHSGERSKMGADLLKKAGFTRVSSLTDGLVAWSGAGYPVVGQAP